VASWLRERQEWKFFAVLPKAHRGLALTWWLLLLLAGTLPAVFAIAMGWTVAAVQSGAPLASPLLLVGTLFVVQQVVGPIRISASQNLGDLVSASLNESLISSCVIPPGVGHLEDPALRGRGYGRREHSERWGAARMNPRWRRQLLHSAPSKIRSAAGT
jgi:ATP-binding cassette, subfamily B, bacterial